MTASFRDLKLSDGRIAEVVIRKDGVLVRLRNWQESLIAIIFDHVIAFEGFGTIDADLSHPSESLDDPMIQAACRQANEPPEGYRCFTLISAWTDEPLLKIVARRAIVHPS